MFRDEIIRHRWKTLPDQWPTHFLLDGQEGGKLSIADKDHGMFLNKYFTYVIKKREALSVVELKTPHYFLFFDVDLLFARATTDRMRLAIRKTIDVITETIWKFVTREFFFLPDTEGARSQTTTTSSGSDRVLVSTSPPKMVDDDREKHGLHLNFPAIVVNAPIALACREKLIRKLETMHLDDENDSISIDSTASSSGLVRAVPLNSWGDIVDDSVFKANGLRMLFSNKGKTEARAYHPIKWIDSRGATDVTKISDIAVRELIKESSIRCVSGEQLTVCTDGEHLLADKLDEHATRGQTIGTSSCINMYSEAFAPLRRALPSVYRDVHFNAAFVTTHNVMLKTNSRYCQNIGGEHRTSTVYFSVSKLGVCQRCYCRKAERGCETYSSNLIKLSDDIIDVFFPGFIDENKKDVPVVTRIKRKDISSVIGRSRMGTARKKT